MIAKTQLLAAAAALTEHWSPKVVARVNDTYVKVAKVKGEFVWHAHAGEDELFHVLKGSLELRFEDGSSVVLDEGDVAVVPRGVQHQPIAREECWLALIEPVETKHTGETVTPLTKTIEQQLA